MSIYENLFPWQKKIVDKYKVKDSYGLFLDMGLGKTPLGLAMAEANNCTKVIIISVNAKALESEFVSFSWLWWASKSSMNYCLLNKYSKTFDANKAELLIVNYESLFERGKRRTERVTLKQNVKDFIASCSKHNVAILVDESHKMKDLQSQQTCAIMKLKKELQRKSKVYTYLLTGTPFTTGYIDLYAQLKMLGSNITKAEFVDTFCVKGNVPGLLGWQQPIVGYKNLSQLYSHIHNYAITIKSEDVELLPEQVFNYHILPSSKDFYMLTNEYVKGKDVADFITYHNIDIPQQFKITYHIDDAYTIWHNKRMANPFYRNIDFPETNWLSETSGQFWMRARQLSIGFNGNASESKWYDMSRLNALKQFLKNNEDNYLLFYNYTPELLELYTICEELGYNTDVYCGEIKSLTFYNKHIALTEEQRLTNRKNIILANFASGSTGLNWQAYNKCIIFSCPVYKDYAQGLKRIHRLGQKQTVIYHVFYQDNWLDKSMNEALASCKEYSNKMFEADLLRTQTLMTD